MSGDFQGVQGAQEPGFEVLVNAPVALNEGHAVKCLGHNNDMEMGVFGVGVPRCPRC